MRSSILLTTLPLVTALPFSQLRRAVTYSIVNVDGGSAPTSSTPPSSAITIIQTLTSSPPHETHNPSPGSTGPGSGVPSGLAPPATETIQQTIFVTDSTSRETVTVTLTPPAPTTTESVKVITVIETVQATESTQYYDDGSWKTLYPVRTETPAISAAEATAIPVPSSEEIQVSTMVSVETSGSTLVGSGILLTESFATAAIESVETPGSTLLSSVIVPTAILATASFESVVPVQTSGLPPLPTLSFVPLHGYNTTQLPRPPRD